MNQQVIIFGEVLFDCFPDRNIILGGAPFNVAWHLQAFGISPLFISRIGKDKYGEKIKEAMINWGMNIKGLQIDNIHPTGEVQVTFIKNDPRYEIVENSAYDFIEYEEIPELKKDSILYHGTLALRNKNCLQTLQQIKNKINPAIFLDVNLRSPFWNLETIDLLLQETTWLKLNEEELPLIVPQESNTEDQIKILFNKYPLNTVTLTKGKEGAISFLPNKLNYNITPFQTNTIVDTVGAGDAFCSVLILGLVKGWKMEKILTRAQEFASMIVGIRGATIEDQSFYNSLLKKWD